jgi:hypothetical protein
MDLSIAQTSTFGRLRIAFSKRYWLSASAAARDRVWSWLNAVRQRAVLIDQARPWVRALATDTVELRDMQDQRRNPRSIIAAGRDENAPRACSDLVILNRQQVHLRAPS